MHLQKKRSIDARRANRHRPNQSRMRSFGPRPCLGHDRVARRPRGHFQRNSIATGLARCPAHRGGDAGLMIGHRSRLAPLRKYEDAHIRRIERFVDRCGLAPGLRGNFRVEHELMCQIYPSRRYCDCNARITLRARGVILELLLL